MQSSPFKTAIVQAATVQPHSLQSALPRCHWCTADPLYQAYHDSEWGKPSHERQYLFEMLCLEGQQAGLSWITVLKKRERYRQQFFNFDPVAIAQLTQQDVAQRLQDRGLIRHAGKLTAIVDNAKAWLALEQDGTTMVEWLWSFVPKPAQPPQIGYDDSTLMHSASITMAKALKRAGFRFVGATTCYAFMQAVGMLNAHDADCFCYQPTVL
ncbi:MAG: DNA-3-methyladenine glycosylase I [Moraxellaceae bacterium]|nr:MAG: DNA-3-methyladenine glycosylase I [Moraxellaceae bacterium]